MTAATGRVAGPKPFAPLADEGGLKFGLAASVAPYRNWLMTLSPTTGLMSQAAANTPGQIAAGFCDRDSAGSSTAGAAEMVGRWNFVSGFPNSTASQDSILATDIAAPFYFVDNQTIGKLSHVTGSNRSLGGLVFGLDDDPTSGLTPIIWCNPLAWLIARGAMIANAMIFGSHQINDAAANTATTERAIVSAKLHGTITGVEFDGAAVAADNTDYDVITISRRDAADAYASATTIATYDTRAAGQGAISAFVPAAFALSAVAGVLNVLETTRYTITVAKNGAGKVLSGAFTINGQVL